jgi:hypothetical protein
MTVSDTKRDQSRTPDAEPATRLSRRTIGWTITVIAGLVAWFFIAWIPLGRTLIDSAGESVGTGFLILVITSIVGTVRRNRRGGGTSAP